MNYTPIQRLTLKGMDNQSLINLIRQAAANFQDTSPHHHTENRPVGTSLLLDRSQIRQYRTGLRTPAEPRDRGIHPLFPHKWQGRFDRHQRLHTRPDNDKEHQLAPVPHVQTPRILTADTGLHTLQQRADIPKQKTLIPPRKHRLLAGD